MSIKFKLKGLAETIIDRIQCPCCKQDSVTHGEQGFLTDLTRVTFDGIVVVVQCKYCGEIFVPDSQKNGIINSQKLKMAVEKDSEQTGDPIYPTRRSVELEAEKLNSQKQSPLH